MKKKKQYTGKIPFCKKTGRQLDSTWEADEKYDWKDNYVFEGTLKYVDYGKGRSSVSITLEGENGVRYNTMLSDFHTILLSGKQHANGWYNKWTFCKKGTAYGIKIYEE